MAKTYERFKSEYLGKAIDIDGAYGAQCLANGTLVHMANGTLTPVENLKVGDRLQGWNLVVSNDQRVSPLIEVKTDCATFKVTPDHRFIDQNGQEIKNLSIGQCVQLDTNEFKNDLNLSADELRFLGFYMGDGTKKYRWKGTTEPEIFVTVGTDRKLEYLQSLNIQHRKIALHSNKKAKLFYLKNSEHDELVNLIHSISGKKLPLFFTREQYQYIIEGYLKADGYEKNNSIVATSVTKELLVSIQHGCILNGWRAILSKPTSHKKTNYCDHHKPLYRLTINKNAKPTGKVISIRSIQDGTISVLNVNGDHTYFAENHKHHNCWDGAMYYSQWLGYPAFSCTVTGYAQDIWTLRNTNGILKYYDEVTDLQAGDIVVFKKHSSTPYSHIAIFDHDAGNGYGAFLGQNQGAPDMSFNIINLPYDATYPTAFRPKRFAQNALIEQESVKAPEKGADGSVYRLYNPNNGDHLYTTSFVEAMGIYMSGWNYEGVAWLSPSDGEPVYRLLNPNGGTHTFAPEEEKNALVDLGWKLEGVAFLSKGNKPIYRMYNPNGGEHILTADIEEHNGLTKIGWTCEGQELKY